MIEALRRQHYECVPFDVWEITTFSSSRPPLRTQDLPPRPSSLSGSNRNGDDDKPLTCKWKWKWKWNGMGDSQSLQQCKGSLADGDHEKSQTARDRYGK